MDKSLRDILEDFNPWWQEDGLPKESELPRRKYYSNLESMVLEGEPGQITVLKGLRRTGKTIMLKQLVASALAKGIYKREQIVFLSGIASELKQKTILRLTHDIRGRFKRDEDWMLIIDEVQFFHDWKRDLTYIADHLPRVRCVASGSSATVLNLWKEQTETGMDRILELKLPPLLFCEYLDFIDSWPDQLPNQDFSSIVNARLDEDALANLNRNFLDYINFGAFPRLAYAAGAYDKDRFAKEIDKLAKKIRTNVITAYIDKDLPQHLGVTDKGKLHNLGKHIIGNPTTVYMQKNYKENLKMTMPTLTRYLKFMEGAYFIRVWRKIDSELRILQNESTHCKFILENCSMTSLVFQNVDEASLGAGQWVENTVLSQFAKTTDFEECGYIHYKRKRHKAIEVDMCHLDPRGWPLMLAEIKWSDDEEAFEKVADGMSHLVKKWGKEKKAAPRMYCTSKTRYDADAKLSTSLQIIPAAQFSIALGIERIQNAPK